MKVVSKLVLAFLIANYPLLLMASPCSNSRDVNRTTRTYVIQHDPLLIADIPKGSWLLKVDVTSPTSAPVYLEIWDSSNTTVDQTESTSVARISLGTVGTYWPCVQLSSSAVYQTTGGGKAGAYQIGLWTNLR